MLLIPAIDLKDGKCVRLRQGLMNSSTDFGVPIDMAKIWVDQGAKRLHLVDLNGAFVKTPVNKKIAIDIVKKFPHIDIQIGGGISNMKIAAEYINAGINYIIIGSKAVTNPKFIAELCNEFPGKIIVGIDANNGFVAIDGWAKRTNILATDMAKKLEQYGVNAIIYTDIARDGMMSGVNIESTVDLAKSTNIDIMASGGITNIYDIIKLMQYRKYIKGAITGRAIYEGKLNFSKANKLCI